jgi:ligand-binding sensor domain-containing protein
MTDTCNTAQKLRRILVEASDDILDLDCMNHLRNVWVGNMEKSLSKYLNDLFCCSLDEIDPRLRVAASISALIRAVDKGHGELFLAWIKEYYLGVLLLHVE